MGMILKEDGKSRSDFELCPAGMAIGLCWAIIDVGKHSKVFNGDKKEVRELMFAWEVHDPTGGNGYRMEEGDNRGKPFSIFNRYTMSLSKKSNLRGKLIQPWLGVQLDDDVLKDKGFDFDSLICLPCQLQLIHNPSRTDASIIYTNLSSISGVMPGIAIPSMENKPILFSLDDYTEAEWRDLPEWVQRKVNREGYGPRPPKPQTENLPLHQAANAAQTTAASFDDFDDDIPF